MNLRLTTFNVENLFNRYAFLDLPWENKTYEKFVAAIDVASIASREGDLVPYEISTIQRNNTAMAILDSNPDILAVQEIENIYTLRNFNEKYLDGYFNRMICIDGNDPRGIDVGLLIRDGLDVEVRNIRTHIDDPDNKKKIVRRAFLKSGYWTTGAIFSRDCLEVDLKVNGSILTLLVNHLKAQDGDDSSDRRRARQATRVAGLVDKAIADGKIPVVMGDFNAEPHHASLTSLLTHPELVDPFADEKDSWTHYYVSGKKVSRLDYILLGKQVTAVTKTIVRNGLTLKCKKYSGPRYPTIGPENTEASDHCPVTVEITL